VVADGDDATDGHERGGDRHGTAGHGPAPTMASGALDDHRRRGSDDLDPFGGRREPLAY
jgi:hypothetical protein